MLHELVLNPACHHTKGEQNGYNMNGGESLTAGLVDALMSEDQQQKSFAKVGVYEAVVWYLNLQSPNTYLIALNCQR